MASAKKNKSKKTPRSVALSVLLNVINSGRSLSQLKDDFLILDDARDRALANELTHGVLRWRWKIEALISPHLKKKLKKKDTDIQIILMIAVYELTELDIPEYASVNEAVALVAVINKRWAKALVNAVLRNVIRNQADTTSVDCDETAMYSHPPWLLAQIKQDWPEQWQDIANANNQKPPIWLRVNVRQNTGLEYQKQLLASSVSNEAHPVLAEALKITSKVNVTQLPDFETGAASVQDAGAQYAANILGVKSGERVLDLCAAPGGKTCHILESSSELKTLVAVDSVEKRMVRLEENLQRLGLDNDLKTQRVIGDASQSNAWWDGELFDCILLDAPCSATGVIRRHPDIKSLRRADDLAPLVELQQKILTQAWQMLAEGGRLLYITCSVLKQENSSQIKQFLTSHADALEKEMDMSVGHVCEFGRQILPGEMDMDGFYYAYLSKQH